MSLLQFLNNGYFAGKVGIGTNSPERLLSLYSDNAETTPRLLIEQDGTGDAVMAFSLTSGQGWSMGIDNSGGDAFMIHNSAGGVDSSSQFTILNSGNVGIGTTSPDRLLELSKSVTGGQGATLRLTNIVGGAGAGVAIEFYGPGSQGIHSKIKTEDLGAFDSNLIFQTKATASAGALADRLTIDNVGAIQFNDYGAGYLKADASGNITAAGASQVGPFLPLAGGTMTGDIVLNDGIKTVYGTANDGLWIYHDGSNSYVNDVGTGTLNLRGSTQVIIGGTNGEVGVQYVENAGVGLRHNNVPKLTTESTGVAIVGNITVDSALLSNQENTDVDSAAAEVVAQVSTTYTAAFFDFVVKKTTNVRSGTVYACHDGTNVEFTETSTNDLGDTSDVTLSVDISGTNMRLLATVTSDDWSVKSLIRAI